MFGRIDQIIIEIESRVAKLKVEKRLAIAEGADNKTISILDQRIQKMEMDLDQKKNMRTDIEFGKFSKKLAWIQLIY